MQDNTGSDKNPKLSATEQFSKSIESLKTNFDFSDVLNQILLIDEAAQSVAKSFGVSKEFSKDIKIQFAGARKEINLMGGTLEDIVKIQLSNNEALGRNVILQSETIEKIFATTKVTGQESKTLISNFKDVGISAFDLVEKMKKVVDTAKDSGVNAQVVSAKVVENLSALNRFSFQGGVDGLAKMAAQATGLRIDMKTTLDFADKVFDPEGAIETAAALQRLGVTQSELLDPLRLLDLSRNNPEELQNQLAQMMKQFTILNEAGNFEIMKGAKARIREISKELGISYEELTKMAIGSSELEHKLSKIKFPDNAFTEQQEMMIANMAEMKGGEYKLTIDGKELGLEEGIKKLSEDKKLLEKFTEKSGKEQMTMEEYAKSQLSVSEKTLGVLNSIANRTGTALSTTDFGEALLGGTSKIFEKVETEISDSLSKLVGNVDKSGNVLKYSNQKLSEGLDKLLTPVTTGLNNLITGDKGLAETFKIFSKSITDFSDSGVMTTLKTGLVGISETIEPFLKEIVKKSDESAESVVKAKDFIRLPGQTIQPLPEDTLFGGTGFENLMERLGGQKTTSVQNTETKTTADINLNIKIDAPSQIDTNQLILAFNNQGLREKMIESMKEAIYNNGLTSPTPLQRTKLMNI
jgi:hypothetical protein